MATRKVYRLKKIKKPFVCKKCEKGFSEERYLQQHLKRKTPCDKKFICPKCRKSFGNDYTLKNHLNRITPCVPEEIPIIDATKEEFRCQYCNKTYSNKHNLKRHQKTCDKEANLQYLMKKLLEENNKEWEKRIEKIVGNTVMPNNTTINNVTVNNVHNVQNNNLYLNVTICSFGNEDLSKLDTTKVMELIKDHTSDFIPKMIEQVHANPELPEYHNVFYDPKKDKAIVFAPISDNEKSWKIRDFKEVSDELTQKIREYIQPGASPYFDMAMKDKDTETGNAIIRMATNTNWRTTEILEKNKNVLTKVSNNVGFLELVDIE